MYINKLIDLHIDTHIYIYIHTYIYIYTHILIYTCINTQRYIYIHVCVYIHTHTHILTFLIVETRAACPLQRTIERCLTQLIRAHIVGALCVRDVWLIQFVEDDSLSSWHSMTYSVLLDAADTCPHHRRPVSSWQVTPWVRGRWLIELVTIERCSTQLIRVHIFGALWVRDKWIIEFVEDDSLSWWRWDDSLSVARRSWYASSVLFGFVKDN